MAYGRAKHGEMEEIQGERELGRAAGGNKRIRDEDKE